MNDSTGFTKTSWIYIFGYTITTFVLFFFDGDHMWLNILAGGVAVIPVAMVLGRYFGKFSIDIPGKGKFSAEQDKEKN